MGKSWPIGQGMMNEFYYNTDSITSLHTTIPYNMATSHTTIGRVKFSDVTAPYVHITLSAVAAKSYSVKYLIPRLGLAGKTSVFRKKSF